MDPLIARWDRTVIHPDTPGEDTIVCCLTDDGHRQTVALILDDEYREALGLQLIDRDGDNTTSTVLDGWGADMADAGLEPYDGALTLDADNKPFLRLHFAFGPDVDDADRGQFLTRLGQLVLGNL
jgi:hypothetical protein